MKFRIWYADGTIFEGTTLEDWKAAPDEGVVTVWCYHERHRYRCEGGDWYYWGEDGIEYVSAHPEWGKWEDRPTDCKGCAKKGVGMPDAEYEAMSQAAWEAPWL